VHSKISLVLAFVYRVVFGRVLGSINMEIAYHLEHTMYLLMQAAVPGLEEMSLHYVGSYCCLTICPVFLVAERREYHVTHAVLRDTIKETSCIMCYSMIIAQSEAWVLLAQVWYML
jgi:hypothetical protein